LYPLLSINEVLLHRAQLLLGWVTVSNRSAISGLRLGMFTSVGWQVHHVTLYGRWHCLDLRWLPTFNFFIEFGRRWHHWRMTRRSRGNVRVSWMSWRNERKNSTSDAPTTSAPSGRPCIACAAVIPTAVVMSSQKKSRHGQLYVYVVTVMGKSKSRFDLNHNLLR